MAAEICPGQAMRAHFVQITNHNLSSMYVTALSSTCSTSDNNVTKIAATLLQRSVFVHHEHIPLQPLIKYSLSSLLAPEQDFE
jgi:hypothetical protein